MLLECHLSAMKTLMESLHDLVDEEDKPSTYRLSGEYVNFLGDELERLGTRSGLSLDEAVSLNLREGRAFADASVSPRRWIVRGWTGTHDSFFRYADGKMNPTDEIFVPTCHQYFLKTFEMHHERRHIQPLFASSRREQRRARKAKKNLVMYKLAGRRPWDCGPFVEVLDSLTRQLGDGQRLRESSGFIDMSKAAEVMR